MSEKLEFKKRFEGNEQGNISELLGEAVKGGRVRIRGRKRERTLFVICKPVDVF